MASEAEFIANEIQPTPRRDSGGSPDPQPGQRYHHREVVNISDSQLPVWMVTLRGYDEMVEVYTQTLTLADGTSLTFQDVPLPPDRMYFASMDYARRCTVLISWWSIAPARPT